MKKLFLLLSTFVLLTLACDMSVTVASPTSSAPQPTIMDPTLAISTRPSESATPTQQVFAPPTQVIPGDFQPTVIPDPSVTASPSRGTTVTYSPLTLVIPQDVANGASGKNFPRIDGDDSAWWQKTPGHLQVMLGDYYILHGKTLQPQVYVYPAQGYAKLVPAAFESIRRVDNILYGSGSLNADQLPAVPFFNAKQLFASNIQLISFQNGSGVRFLTEYAQYPASVNNADLFYNFQGVTRDGLYYVIAIFPISVPVLAETSDAGAALPDGGVPYPYFANPNSDMQSYYKVVTELLNVTPPEAFTPTINQLDLLIQSMQIAP